MRVQNRNKRAEWNKMQPANRAKQHDAKAAEAAQAATAAKAVTALPKHSSSM